MSNLYDTNTKEALFAALLNGKDDMFAQAHMMEQLCSKYSFTQNALAKQLHISQSAVGNKIRLLQYSAQERALILQHRLSERHARALLRILPPKRTKLIETVGRKHLTVQQTEELVDKYKDDSSDFVQRHSQAFSQEVLSIDSFTHFVSANTERLRNLGYKVSCLTESGESWRRFIITICE